MESRAGNIDNEISIYLKSMHWLPSARACRQQNFNATNPPVLKRQCWLMQADLYTQLHTPVQRPFSGTTQVSRYQKGKANLDFTEARDSEWQWHQLGHMQVCTSLQTDNHASTPPPSFLQA